MIEKFNSANNSEHEDKMAFIRAHEREIAPVLATTADGKELERIAHSPHIESSDHEFVDDAIESFETKIFLFENPNGVHGKRVLVTADNPGAFRVIKSVTEELMADERVSGITALVSGIAGKEFAKTFPVFTEFKETGSVLADAMRSTETKPVDVALASMSVRNGPETPILYSGLENFGAAKIYMVIDGWGAGGSAFENAARMDRVEGIFCNDELARELIARAMPQFPKDHIHIVGITADLELDQTQRYREETRAALGIPQDAFVALYVGDVSGDYKALHSDPAINTRTFDETLAALEQFAAAHQSRKTVLIARPHPRAAGTIDAEHFKNIARERNENARVSIKDGSSPFTMNQIAYGSDIIMSILSTENLLAPARARPSVFLGYKGPGMGGEALEKVYGEELLSAVDHIQGVSRVASQDDLVRVFENIHVEQSVLSPQDNEATKRIIDAMLA